MSTDYVYDGSKQGRYLESDATAPLGVYGASKLAGEEAIRASGIPHLIFRTSWVYGMRGKNFLLTMLKLLRERDQLRVVADQIGAPTWCRSIADASAHALAQAHASDDQAVWWQQKTGTYHLTCQGETSWHGFTQAIMALHPSEKKVELSAITSAEYPTPAKRPSNSRLDCSKFQQQFCSLPDWQLALALCVAK
ncbi:MAG: sugar nucleotide-binding protein [Burkholderiales bacterium]|nr:sugar nucleotide-binding protein [Burkholderiales bacterium]